MCEIELVPKNAFQPNGIDCICRCFFCVCVYFMCNFYLFLLMRVSQIHVQYKNKRKKKLNLFVVVDIASILHTIICLCIAQFGVLLILLFCSVRFRFHVD